MGQITVKEAEAIAISGLQFLASDDALLLRFSDLTGILPNDMRKAVNDPRFLSGIIDFYLSHEPDLLAWTGADGIDPGDVAEARFALVPDDRTGFQ